MAKISIKGSSANTMGNIPSIGSKASPFNLTKNDLTEVSLDAYKGMKKILNVFPSLDTATCAMSVRRFNKEAADLPKTVVLNISADLPFAQARFCAAEGINNAHTLSTFRSTFSNDYNVEIIDSPLKGLCSRAVLVLDENDRVIYSEQVNDISSEPNYEKALGAINKGVSKN